MESNLSILFADTNQAKPSNEINKSKSNFTNKGNFSNFKDREDDKKTIDQTNHGNSSYQGNKIRHNYKSDQLCKFFITGSCHKGNSCHFSHDLKKFPCKYYHALGYCDKANFCPFSHFRLLTEKDIFNFIEANIDFLNELNMKIGWNNMDEFYRKYLQLNKPTPSTTVPEDLYKINQIPNPTNSFNTNTIPSISNYNPTYNLPQSIYKIEAPQVVYPVNNREAPLQSDETNNKKLIPNFIDPFNAFK